MSKVLQFAVCFALVTAATSLAIDKNGVSPQVISLPTGPGSIQGLGESFQPQLNNGSGAFNVPLELPSGPTGHAPQLSLQYNSGNGNGVVGMGWSLDVPFIGRNIDEGLPFYSDNEPNLFDDDFDGEFDNLEEMDRFTGVDREELIPIGNGYYRAENEGGFIRYEKLSSGWEAHSKSGIRFTFGTASTGRIESGTKVFRWLLEEVEDLNNNSIRYKYFIDTSSPGQKYLREICWAGTNSFYAVVFSYSLPPPDLAARPDVLSDYRSTFEVTTSRRLKQIDVIGQGLPTVGSPLVGDFNGDGISDVLIRRYVLEYIPNNHVSLLSRVTQFGNDGATTLPPIIFAYTQWQPLDGQSATVVHSVGDPQTSLESDDVELIDMNGDALPDMLITTGGNHHVVFNQGLNGSGLMEWKSGGVPVLNAPSAQLSQDTVHLADLNASGLSDFVVKFGVSTYSYYANAGVVGMVMPSWSQPVILTKAGTAWPAWPFENPESRTLDLDHNRFSDILLTGTSTYSVWHLLPAATGTGSTYSKQIPKPIATTETGLAFHFDMPGAHIADLNGDRLQDLVLVQGVRIVYWPSQGRGDFGEPVELPLDTLIPFSNLNSVHFTDVNGDGLADLILFRPSGMAQIWYWINKHQQGFVSADSGRLIVTGVPAVPVDGDIRFVDMDGNGSTDILISISNAPDKLIQFVPGIRPNLLTTIENGLGRKVTIEYVTSVDQMIRARSANNPWTTTMPISVPVVARITDGDSRGNIMVREIKYRDPFYDSDKQEFRGFAFAEVKEIGDASIPTRVTRNWFDTGMTADCLKGKLLAQEVADDSGKLFTRTENTWSFRTPALANSDVCFAFNSASDIFVYEGIESKSIPCAGKKPATGTSCSVESSVQLRTEFEFDDFGNATENRQFGITESGNHTIGSDELIASMQYILDTTAWIIDRPWRQQVTSLGGDVAAVSLFAYDGNEAGTPGCQCSTESVCAGGPKDGESCSNDTSCDCLAVQIITKGNLTQQTEWLDTENRWISSIRNEYDSYGNITRITDANDHFRTIDYDTFVHLFPITETVHLESRTLTTTANYDFGLGVVVSAIDFAGTQTSFAYDSLGRLKGIARPGGALQSFDYNLADPISSIVTKVREDTTGNTFDSFSYFDGLGRELGMKIEAEAGQWRFVNAVAFNARGQVHESWLPYFTSTSTYEQPDAINPKLATQYDAPARAVRATNPDGTFTRVIFQPLVQHIWDENDNTSANSPKTLKMDGLERLIEVQERNVSTCDPAQATCVCDDTDDNCYKTRYTWSTLGDLTQIRDAQDNIKTITYDSLRRKTFMNDPDRGHMTFEYDDVGNLKKTIDAKAQGILFGYDFANRLLTENYLDQTGDPATDPIDVTYRYDVPSTNVDFGDTTSGDATFTGGRLASVKDISGEEHFSYDDRGNILWSAKGIIDPKLGVLSFYTTRFNYDPMDRVVDIIFPDNDRVHYEYNNASFVERINGGSHPDAKTILSNVDYEPTSQLNSVVFGNGVTTSYTYDNRDRLDTLQSISPQAGDLINYSYTYDHVSNIMQITDNRPFDGPNSIPASNPRRNTQMYQYDDLYRLTQAKYSPLADGIPTHGQIDYTYDKIGNMLSKSSSDTGAPGHINDFENVNIGAMEIGGGTCVEDGQSGPCNRTGRDPNDSPGPHALTKTTNGVTPDGIYEYDANGNMTNLNGATLTWDFKDRLSRYEKDDVNAYYSYDFTDRRITKLVTKGGQTTQTLYPNRAFEVRPNQAPTKFIFSGESRVARAKGTLDPNRDRVQRFWLFDGWNFVTLAVDTEQTVAEIFGTGGFVFRWDGDLWQLASNSEVLSVGEPIWVLSPTAQIASAVGLYDDSPLPIPIPAGLHPIGWPRLEPFTPDLHVSGNISLHVFEAQDERWLLRDSTLPPFVSDLRDSVNAATALWATGSSGTAFLLGAGESQDLIFYHVDHLGSTNVRTNTSGYLLNESSSYPYGSVRIQHSEESVGAVQVYAFTGKESDREGVLQYFVARYYSPSTGSFISADPAGLVPTSRLEPARLNGYTYSLGNPLRFVDPDGRKGFDLVKIEKALRRAQQFVGEGFKNVGKFTLFSTLDLFDDARVLSRPVQKVFAEAKLGQLQKIRRRNQQRLSVEQDNANRLGVLLEQGRRKGVTANDEPLEIVQRKLSRVEKQVSGLKTRISNLDQQINATGKFIGRVSEIIKEDDKRLQDDAERFMNVFLRDKAEVDFLRRNPTKG